jgi:hypothetical protein
MLSPANLTTTTTVYTKRIDATETLNPNALAESQQSRVFIGTMRPQISVTNSLLTPKPSVAPDRYKTPYPAFEIPLTGETPEERHKDYVARMLRVTEHTRDTPYDNCTAPSLSGNKMQICCVGKLAVPLCMAAFSKAERKNKNIDEITTRCRSVASYDAELEGCKPYADEWKRATNSPPEFTPDMGNFPSEVQAIKGKVYKEQIVPILLSDSFIAGEFHDTKSPIHFMTQNMELLKKNGFTIIFTEHATVEQQNDIDNYLNDPSGQVPLPPDFESDELMNFIETAKEHGIRIVGIDSFIVNFPDKAFSSPEEESIASDIRLASMNKIAVDIIGDTVFAGKCVIDCGLNNAKEAQVEGFPPVAGMTAAFPLRVFLFDTSDEGEGRFQFRPAGEASSGSITAKYDAAVISNRGNFWGAE